ncbi:hydroxyisourate hydrolase [Streptosporangium sp. NBC_01639]|uniref:hydroxyisourate hydrolase n=1 Tax=unclassified Streptosporangium TaxID=2632669 RepID=UPI002DDB2391|nr:hydroxyisourate hydrolase [Streptosporangium sp. NBC_01756]WSC88635.1 hydroxyisourate hydrolase [Streptosporangium sp. NBC_01756]WTD52669.1 hydroxyisourate hydrolase [Streptosporangium sp. NBC_01639]
MAITVQALDSVYGRAAAGVRATLEQVDNGHWQATVDAVTDRDGYIKEWGGRQLKRGLYRIVLDSGYYFVGLGLSAAYPEISVVFRIENEVDTYQIQVLLSPHSYSAYLGSSN